MTFLVRETARIQGLAHFAVRSPDGTRTNVTSTRGPRGAVSKLTRVPLASLTAVANPRTGNVTVTA